MKVAVFTGSFNPFTIGHADIVQRALNIFDMVVIGVGFNTDKLKKSDNQTLLNNMREICNRVENIKAIYTNEPRVDVKSFSDLTVDFAKRCSAVAIVKGVRSVKDYEYERGQADINKQLSGIDTILFFSSPELSAISSSAVRTLKEFGQDVSKFLPKKSNYV